MMTQPEPSALPLLARIPLDQIVNDPTSERGDLDPSSIIQLAGSLQEWSQVEPVRLIELGDHQYMINSGHRRVAAARLIRALTIVAIIHPNNKDAHDWRLDRLISNVHREDLTPPQLASALADELDHRPELTQRQLGTILGMKQSTVSNFLRLRNLPPAIQQLLNSRSLSYSHALRLLEIHADEYDAQGSTGRTAADVQLDFAREAVQNQRSLHNLGDTISNYLRRQQFFSERVSLLPAPPVPSSQTESAADSRQAAPSVSSTLRPLSPLPHRVATLQIEETTRQVREQEVLQARQQIADTTIDQILEYRHAAPRSIQMDRLIAAVLFFHPQVLPDHTLLSQINTARDQEQLRHVQAVLARHAIRLNEQNHALDTTLELAQWVDTQWSMNRAIATALLEGQLITPRTYASLIRKAGA